MTRVLTLLTLVVSFASLQLSLLSGGPGCPMPATGANALVTTMAGRDMAGMDMAGPSAVSTAVAASGQSPAPSAPCDVSTAPQACPTMAPCVFAVLVPLATAESPVGPLPTRVATALVRTPSLDAPAPELPPPRSVLSHNA